MEIIWSIIKKKLTTWLTAGVLTLLAGLVAELEGFPPIVSILIGLAAVTFLVLLFRIIIDVADKWGWLDEFKEWLIKGQKIPEVVVDYYFNGIDGKWQVTAREADAFNITSEPIRSGLFHAVIKTVGHLSQNQTVNLTFSFYKNNEVIRAANGGIVIGPDLWQMFRSAYLESQISHPKTTGIAPVTIHYHNARGIPFRSECEILFSGDKPEIKHKGVKVGRRGSALS